MVSPFSSSSTTGSTSRRLSRHALYLAGALVGLWVVVQATAFVPSAEGADEQNTETVLPSSASSSDSGLEVFTWGNAAAVLLLVGAGGYALYVRQQETGATGHAAFQSVERLALGQSKQLRLVACGDEVLLIGVTDEDVTLLKTYSHDAFEEHPALSDAGGKAAGGGPPAAPSSMDFGDVLNRFAHRTQSS